MVNPWLLICSEWVTKMSREISNYERDVIKRIEEIRERDGVTQESFAELMQISIAQYKRCAYFEARVSLEAIYNLANAYPVDVDYIIFGKHKGKYTIINSMVSESWEEKAKYFDELAAYFRERNKIAMKEQTRRNERAKGKKPKVDYVTKEGDVIETDNKK